MTEKAKNKKENSGQRLSGKNTTLKPLLFCPENRVHPTIPIQVKNNMVWIRNELPTIAAKGYQLLQIKPPDRVLQIKEIKSEAPVVVPQK